MKTFFIFLILLLSNSIISANHLRQTLKDISVGFDVPCGVIGGGDNRIVNGKITEPHELPWLVSLQKIINNKFSHTCGSSIIHPSWVLTAAHCFPDDSPKDSFRLVAGAHNLEIEEDSQQIRSIENIYLNLYDVDTIKNDIALIKVNKDFVLDGQTVAPICLPDKYDQEYSGTVIYAGWGDTKENGKPSLTALQKISQQTIPHKQCNETYTDIGYEFYIHDCQVCSGSDIGEATCQGDSGGPGMYVKNGKYYIWGAVSWGAGCGNTNYPEVNTDVSCYGDWITKTVNDN